LQPATEAIRGEAINNQTIAGGFLKQVLQDLQSGETILAEVPAPVVQPGQVLIATERSLISVGTERMLVEFGKANLLDKARQQPEKVKMVLDKVKTDGIQPTLEAVKAKLEQPLPLGYCNVGRVIESGCEEFKPGDRVVSNGGHAEVVRVAKNLCCKIPDAVSDDEAAFTVLGAIALQGIRLIAPTLGESIVVTGLGLVGLLTIQLLRASGCRVLGIDFDSEKCELARQLGAETVDLSRGEDPISAAAAFSAGRGVDGVIISASSKSSEPVHQAATMCRKRGRIVLVGVVGLQLSRADFYEKELTFQVSCSYGPGRYDADYEEYGNDYPLGFVRWTEQRNFEAVLDMIGRRALQLDDLISHRFDLSEAAAAYEQLSDSQTLGIILQYQAQSEEQLLQRRVVTAEREEGGSPDAPRCAFLGGGNYASRVLMPAFKAAGVELHTLVTSGGTSAAHHGARQGFSFAATDAEAMLADETVNTVVIATQHNLHADQVVEALQAGKHVFVEKPLALHQSEVERIESCYQQLAQPRQLMVGFNRRFAPHIRTMRSLLAPLSVPKSFIMTMNAGAIPADHWTQLADIGGGRIVGEACHYIDLMRFLVGHPIIDYSATAMGEHAAKGLREDKASITLRFADGSFGSIHYLANGGKAFPKERIEVFCDDAVLQLDNFRNLKGFGWQGFSSQRLWRQDKGQNACVAAFANAISGGDSCPIAFEEIVEVAKISIEIAAAIRNQ